MKIVAHSVAATSSLYRVFTITVIYLRQFSRRPFYLICMVLSFSVVMLSVALTFSVREGLSATLEASAEPGWYFMINAHSNTELMSQITRSEALAVNQLDDSGSMKRVSSPEVAILARQKVQGVDKEFIVRGVTDSAFTLKNSVSGADYLRIVDGRSFAPDRNEVIVGVSLRNHYPEFSVGNSITLRGQSWKIVGAFTSGGSVRESEFWSDLVQLRTDYGLGPVYSVVVFSGPVGANISYNSALAALERDVLTIRDSHQHYSGQAQDLIDLIMYFGLGFSTLAGIVAVTGVAALIESLLLDQAAQLRVLALIGYGRERFTALIMQVGLLGALGGALGLVACLGFFSGMTFTTYNQSRELAFEISISSRVIFASLIYCSLLGVVSAALVLPRLRGKIAHE